MGPGWGAGSRGGKDGARAGAGSMPSRPTQHMKIVSLARESGAADGPVSHPRFKGRPDPLQPIAAIGGLKVVIATGKSKRTIGRAAGGLSCGEILEGALRHDFIRRSPGV